jgi:hypothetical protein
MSNTDGRAWRRAIFCLFVLAAVAALFALPFQLRSHAAKGQTQRSEGRDTALPDYDIRTDKKAAEKIVSFRTAQDITASKVADVRDAFVRGEAALKQRIPTLKIEYNDDIRIPEVIGPEVKLSRHFLTAATRPAGSKHADVLIGFLKDNTDLVGVNTSQIDDLKVAADYTNPDGVLSFVELNQQINGIRFFAAR